MSDDATDKTQPAKEAKAKPAKPAKGKQAKGKPAKDKKGKGKAAGKKGGGGETQAEVTSAGPSVAAHPRAGDQVRRAKGWGGLASFAIAAYLSIQAGVPTYEVGIRALIAGLAGYLLAWACSVTVWRHLVLAEMRAVHEPKPDHAKGSLGDDGGMTPQPERS